MMEEGESENEVVVMLDRLDKMLEQSDKCHGDDPVVQERLMEQHNLIRELGMKFKFSVYKGIVMEARNANLLNENEALQLVVNEEKERAIQIQKKLKHLEESAETFKKIKQEYEELTLSLKEGVLSLEQIHEEPEKPEMVDKGTTCWDLFITSDKDTQTWVPSGCAKCLSGEQQRSQMEAKLGPTVVLTQADLNRLDEDMQALKDSLRQRDKSWAKMEKRDKSQRARLCRLDSELVSMKEMANNRKQEIENKTILIKSLEAQVKKEQREIANLKKSVATRGRHKSVGKKRSANKSPQPQPQPQQQQPVVVTPAAKRAREELEDEPSRLSLVASTSSPTPTPKRTPTPAPKRTPTPTPSTKLKQTPAQTSMPTPKAAPTALVTPKSCVSTGLTVPSHVLTSESRLRERQPSGTRGGRENLGRTNDRSSRKSRNRSILTRTNPGSDSPPRTLNINLNEGRF